MGREDSLYHTYVVCDWIRIAICCRWNNRAGAGADIAGFLLPRYLLCDGALPPGYGRGVDLWNVRGDIFLVPENVWPDDERRPGQVSLLDYVPRRLRDLRSLSRNGNARHATTLFAI